MVDLAKTYFGLIEDDRQRCIVGDGAELIRKFAERGKNAYLNTFLCKDYLQIPILIISRLNKTSILSLRMEVQYHAITLIEIYFQARFQVSHLINSKLKITVLCFRKEIRCYLSGCL